MSKAPAICLGRRDPFTGEYDCDHRYAGEITCDHCCFGPDKNGLDPRYPREYQPPKKKDAQ